MDFQHLKYLNAIERTGSITRAARELFMSQPNLSRAVKEVEHETGFPIFRRTSRGVEPTERGLPFLDYARKILSQMDEMESLYKTPRENVISMDVSVPAAACFAAALGDYLGGLPPKAPLSIHCRESTSLEAVSNVASGQSKFAIIRYNNLYRDYFDNALKNAQLTGEVLWEFCMCLLLGGEHPLVPCGQVPYHLLDGFTEIVYGDLELPALSFTKISFGAKMKEERRQIHVYDSGAQYHLLKSVPGAYMWSSPLPFGMTAAYGLVQKECPISDGMCSDVLIYRQKQPPAQEARAFLECVGRYTRKDTLCELPQGTAE